MSSALRTRSALLHTLQQGAARTVVLWDAVNADLPKKVGLSSVHRVLTALHEEGLVRHYLDWSPGVDPKHPPRVYELTALGQKAAEGILQG